MAEFHIDIKTATADQLKAFFADRKARVEALKAEALALEVPSERLAKLEELEAVRGEMESIIAEQGERTAAEAATAREKEILAKLDTELEFPEAASPTDPEPVPEPVDPEPAPEVPAEAAQELAAATAAIAKLANESLGGTAQPAGQAVSQETKHEERKSAWVAGVGAKGVNAGQALTDQQLADSFENMVSMARSKQTYSETIVASASVFKQGDELLSANNTADRNTELIHEAQAEYLAKLANPAFTASPVCTPFQILEDLPEGSTKVTPFSDALPFRGAGRLGFQWNTPWSLANIVTTNTANNAFFKVYDPDAQDDIGPDNLKPCAVITCPGIDSMEFDEITACVKVKIQTEMSNPRSVQAFMGKVAALRARLREQYLMGKFDAQAAGFGSEDSPVTVAYGSIPGIAEAILRYYLSQTYDERLADKPAIVFVPRGVLALQDLDSLSADDGNATLATLQSYLRERVNVRLVEVYDNHPAQAGAIRPNGKPFAGATGAAGQTDLTLPALPCLFRLRVMFPQSLIAASTGEFVAGWQSDPQLLRENMVQYFTREFVNLKRTGEDPQGYIDVKLPSNGARAGYATPWTCTFTS